MRMTRCLSLTILLSFPLWLQAESPRFSSVYLKDGERHTIPFTVRPAENSLIWLRARIALSEGEQPGAYALKISLNGKLLTPANVKVLNTKNAICDGPRDSNKSKTNGGMPAFVGPLMEVNANTQARAVENFSLDEPSTNDAAINETSAPDWDTLPLPDTDIGAVPAFDTQSGAWYLKADSDDIAFNDADTNSNYRTADPANTALPFADMMARATRRSHYYEYLLEVPGALIQAGDTLEIAVELPDRLNPHPVRIDGVRTQPVGDGCVLYTRPWVEFVYPWQAPSLDDVVDPAQGLTLYACAGEYEPTAFSIYSLNTLTGLTVQVESLHGSAGQPAIAPDQITCYRGDSVICEAGQSGLDVPWNRGNLSPELLKPQPKGGLTLKGGRSQTFMLDVRVPDNQPPGIYQGTVVVRTASGVLRKLPLHLEVYPFTLAPPRQTFWMWRLQWSPDWEPDNVACLKDIKEHGASGLVRTGGSHFNVAISKDGTVTIDDSEMRKFVEVLDQIGLEQRLSDTGIAPPLASAAAAHVGLKLQDVGAQLPDLKSFLLKGLEAQSLKAEADAHLATAVLDDLLAPAKPDNDPLLLDSDPKEQAKLKKNRLQEEAARQAAAYYARINPLIVEGFRQVKKSAEALGLEYYVFPVDEPCGTPWRRGWVKYVSTLAHEAGLKIWNTHNDLLGWDSGIDVSCAGAGIAPAYTPLTIQRGAFEGGLAFPAIPNIGQWDDRAGYGFNGLIDEVRIYHRALTEKEMLRQREQPATSGLLAHYPMDEGKGETVADASGNRLDATVVGDATWDEGKLGKALRFNNGAKDQLRTPETPPASNGWSISFWMKGRGNPFGRSHGGKVGVGCLNGASLTFATTSPAAQSFSFGVQGDAGFWTHVTLSLDNRTKQWKALFQNDEQRDWYRRNIHWNYVQVRGRWAPFQRPETGYCSWFNFVSNVTLFCYDWNWGSTYLVYPEGGRRFHNRPNTQWYGTLGWMAVREGIDDNRYMQTLFLAAKEKNRGDEEKALQVVRDALAPLDEPYDWKQLVTCYTAFGDFDGMRRHVVGEIMKNMQQGRESNR